MAISNLGEQRAIEWARLQEFGGSIEFGFLAGGKLDRGKGDRSMMIFVNRSEVKSLGG
ncbi:MAG: hypothetical protein HC849_33290 [Oscillatoriales cyanobacterium RU_3_3]|nr:hypothetical protein [Oscillatoriales cyanobacterium RU_3_3]